MKYFPLSSLSVSPLFPGFPYRYSTEGQCQRYTVVSLSVCERDIGREVLSVQQQPPLSTGCFYVVTKTVCVCQLPWYFPFLNILFCIQVCVCNVSGLFVLLVFSRAVSTFWIANPNNNLISNAAAGSQVITSASCEKTAAAFHKWFNKMNDQHGPPLIIYNKKLAWLQYLNCA